MKWLYRFFLFLLVMLDQGAFAQSVFRVGWQSPSGPSSTYNISNSTFSYVNRQLGADFEIVPFSTDSDLVNAMTNRSIDFIYASPTTIYCSIVSSNDQPLATVVSLTEDGTPYNSLTGSIITLNTSGITTLRGVVGRTVGAGQLTGLTTFQSEFDLLNQNNISLFTQARAVVAYPSSLAIIQALLQRQVDVGFIESAQLGIAAMKGIDVSAIQVLLARPQNNTPFLASTQTFSSSALAAAQYINNTFRTRVVKSLLSMRPDDPATVAAGIYGWAVPQSFLTIRKLMQSTGLLNAAGTTCNDLTNVYAFITCPTGYVRKDNVDLANSCAGSGFTCPEGATLCVCSPCEVVVPPRRVGALPVPVFAAVVCLLVLLGGGLAVVVVLVHRLRQHIVPYGELHVQDLEVGRSIKGRVLLGTYRSQSVVVKRAMGCEGCHMSVFDHDDMPQRSVCWDTERGNWVGKLRDCAVCVRVHLAFFSRKHRLIRKIGQARKIRHPNVLPVLGCSIGPHYDELFVVTEYAESGTLMDLLNNKTLKIDEPGEISLALDIARGVAHLHCLEPPVYTRNVRTHRVFVDQDMRAKIGMSFSPFNRRTIWNPPEVVRGGPQTASSNAFKFGMLLYEIAFRRPPFVFHNTTEEQVVEAITTADEFNIKDTLPRLPRPHPFNETMQTCWAIQPEDRPTFTAICLELQQVLPPQARNWRSNSVDGNLLDTILPPDIARQMKEGKEIEPQHFDSCSIFFSDVVGFTTISSFLSPSGVVDMLARLYNAFEGLVTKYDLFKVETIGDSFMVAANIQRDHAHDHAARLVRFALEAMQVARTIDIDANNPKVGKLKIRAGIHSGKCVATVIGKQAPRYCLFGDCVNVASRMESNSLPNRLNISNECRKLVEMQDPSLKPCLYRRPGKVDVKGKGRLVCFWVMSQREAAARGLKQTDDQSEPGSRELSCEIVIKGDDRHSDSLTRETSGMPTIHENVVRSRSHSAESLHLDDDEQVRTFRRSLEETPTRAQPPRMSRASAFAVVSSQRQSD